MDSDLFGSKKGKAFEGIMQNLLSNILVNSLYHVKQPSEQNKEDGAINTDL
jgi:hypothetical protein